MPISAPNITIIIHSREGQGKATVLWTTTGAIGLKLNGQPVSINGSKTFFNNTRIIEQKVTITLEATGPTGLKTIKNFILKVFARGKY